MARLFSISHDTTIMHVSTIATLFKHYFTANRWLEYLAIPLALGLRLYLAEIFFRAGLTKIQSWETTVALFESEYKVPVLSPQIAALSGTGAELLLPPLLVLGLGTRFTALALFVFNAVALVSYPDISEAGIKDHQYWGVLLAVLVAWGPGKASLDHFIGKRFGVGRPVSG